jgi:hypothetical protein
VLDVIFFEKKAQMHKNSLITQVVQAYFSIFDLIYLGNLGYYGIEKILLNITSNYS